MLTHYMKTNLQGEVIIHMSGYCQHADGMCIFCSKPCRTYAFISLVVLPAGGAAAAALIAASVLLRAWLPACMHTQSYYIAAFYLIMKSHLPIYVCSQPLVQSKYLAQLNALIYMLLVKSKKSYEKVEQHILYLVLMCLT